MITKKRLIEHVNEFPENLDIEDLIERLLLIGKLEMRIKRSENDETISEQELEKDIAGWFK